MIPCHPFIQDSILIYPLKTHGDLVGVKNLNAPSSGVWAGTFTRLNGVSPPPYDSLNVGFHVGDDPINVKKNREIIRQKIGAEFLISAKQSHGDRIAHIDGYIPEEGLSGIDALITNVKCMAIMIQHADCQAVGLYDAINSVIANVHCGWRGCVNGIVKKTVNEMVAIYGTSPSRLQAFISPSIGSCCAEFKDWERIFPAHFKDYMVGPAHFDLWAITKHDLVTSGLLPENIITANTCTVCSKDYFSYRRETVTGRCATVMLLR